MKSKINLDIQLTTCQYWGRDSDVNLLPNETYTLLIDYPFNKPGYYKIKTGKTGMGIGGLLGKIYDCYIKQYDAAKTDKEQGYWHGIGDLAIEGIEVDHTRKEIKLSVGS
jgi:hypothetical protein